jgi:hypothetical protein
MKNAQIGDCQDLSIPCSEGSDHLMGVKYHPLEVLDQMLGHEVSNERSFLLFFIQIAEDTVSKCSTFRFSFRCSITAVDRNGWYTCRVIRSEREKERRKKKIKESEAMEQGVACDQIVDQCIYNEC